MMARPIELMTGAERLDTHGESCGKKIRHETEAGARNHIVLVQKKGHTNIAPYYCSHCLGWHVGGSFSAEAITIEPERPGERADLVERRMRLQQMAGSLRGDRSQRHKLRMITAEINDIAIRLTEIKQYRREVAANKDYKSLANMIGSAAKRWLIEVGVDNQSASTLANLITAVACEEELGLGIKEKVSHLPFMETVGG